MFQYFLVVLMYLNHSNLELVISKQIYEKSGKFILFKLILKHSQIHLSLHKKVFKNTYNLNLSNDTFNCLMD